ncbi:D-ribose-binding periplasmic protein precursor [Polystyrenella longa]|uniref:D-ribose-binding periplasmic protein n=1 Tax=Polystyrenella longa TaxID=2528007 RepID=A0A518CPF4_9PLAN|nr:substrate-binding domain-containing protein [Polystyrenella longa]QDU81099.1 D-ribose-binding periplasmic protein precursor [Polystyrenella longa]
MKRFAVLLAALALIGCAGSDSADSSADNGEKTYRIAVIPKGTTHEFWKSVHYGAEQAAKEHGNVEILWKGPQLENDREGQISVVQNFIGNVDGIVLAPLDSQALVEYVDEAVEYKIPVVIFDSGLDDTSNIVSYVATDNYNGGAMAARRMGELLNGEGDVILLRYNPGSESTEQREEAFLETLKKEFPNVNILSSDQYSGTTPASSLAKATQVLDTYKNEVDGIFAVCEPNAAGTLKALQELELAGDVKFIAFDPNTDLANGLSDGTVHGIVLQDPVAMGYLGVKTLLDHIDGNDIDKRVNTGEYVATPENMKEEEMSNLLAPPQFGGE